MRFDQHLTDLLAREAKHADVAPPTREGVQTATSRLAVRRRRRRASIIGLAALCLLGGVASGLALAGDREDPDTGFAGTEPLPDVPLLGVDLPGWELNFARRDDGLFGNDSSASPAVTYAIFERGTAPFGSSSIWVTIGPADLLDGEEDPTPVDLDGDGSTDGTSDGWQLASPDDPPTIAFARGSSDSVAATGFGVAVPELLEYTSNLRAEGAFTVDAVPPPDGFVLNTVTTLPGGRGPVCGEQLPSC